MDVIARTIAKRVSRFLEKEGYLVRDAESEYLDLLPDEDDAMSAIIGASITDRLAFGPNAGRKALTLQTVPVRIANTLARHLSAMAPITIVGGVTLRNTNVLHQE